MQKIINCAAIWLITLFMYISADFTIGVNGDTQNLVRSDGDAQRVEAMNQFYVDRKDELNMKFVISVGDMSSDGGVGSSQWSRLKDAYEVLNQADIPFAPCQGNHDELDGLNDAFPVSDFENTPTWGGARNDNEIHNAYYYFTADGMDFMILVHQENPESGPREWVKGIYEANPDKRSIHVNHNIQEVEVDWVSLTIIREHDHIFLGLAGHDCANDGEVYWTVTSKGAGVTQHIARSDYQCRSNGGALVRYYTFKTAEDQVCAFTYNITEEAYERDANSEFCFDYDMESAAATHILTFTNGTGGSITTDKGTTLEFAPGTEVELTAVADQGFEFAGWGGDLSGTENPQTVTVTADMNISADFTPVTSLALVKQQLRALPFMISGTLDLTHFKNATSISFFDMSGTKLFSRQLSRGRTKLDLSGLEQGRYLIKLAVSEGYVSKSLFVMRGF